MTTHDCGPHCNPDTCKVQAQEQFSDRQDVMDDGLNILSRVVNHDPDCRCHWCSVAGTRVDGDPICACGHGESFHKHADECRFEDCRCQRLRVSGRNTYRSAT